LSCPPPLRSHGQPAGAHVFQHPNVASTKLAHRWERRGYSGADSGIFATFVVLGVPYLSLGLFSDHLDTISGFDPSSSGVCNFSSVNRAGYLGIRGALGVLLGKKGGGRGLCGCWEPSESGEDALSRHINQVSVRGASTNNFQCGRVTGQALHIYLFCPRYLTTTFVSARCEDPRATGIIYPVKCRVRCIIRPRIQDRGGRVPNQKD